MDNMPQNVRPRSRKGWLYIPLGILFWMLIDFGVGYKFNIGDWVGGMPGVWIFYLSWPVLFYYLFYIRLWDESRGMILVIILSYIIEAVLLSNPLVFTLPFLILYIPVTFILYGFITLTPLWIVEGKMREHGVKILIMTLVALVFSVFV